MSSEQLRCGRLRLATSGSSEWPLLFGMAGTPLTLCRVSWGRSFLPFLRKLGLRRRQRHAVYLQKSLHTEFWGGSGQDQGMRKVLGALASLGRSMLQSGVKQLAVLDVGAASYEGPDRCHAAEMAVLLGCSASFQIHAFEPLPRELERTRRSTEQRLRRDLSLGRRAARRCISWQQRAVSNASGEARLRGSANQASLSRHIPAITGSADYASQEFESVMTQRLDDFAREVGLAPSLLLKIDTEGHDLEVLQGARSLLEAGDVAAIVFEVAGQMNPDFFRLHKEQKRVDHRVSLAEPTLESMVRWLGALGYESFLLGSRSLIPLSGSWWDKSFEVCWSRRDLSCWYDVLALPRAGRSGFWSAFAPRTVLLQAFAEI